jgi:alpha-L-fucosidase 2
MAKISRRSALTATAAALTGGAIFQSPEAQSAAPDAPSRLTLWYKQPAAVWTEALPLGNGRLGAMVYGGVGHEQLQLNEDTLWSGSPYNPVHKGAFDHLAEARKLVFDGKYVEAEAFLNAEMMAVPVRQQAYQTIGNVLMTMGVSTMASGYRRDLDLTTAVATVTYKQGDTTFTREMFISPVDQVMVVRLTADKPGKIGCDIGFETPQNADDACEGADQLVLKGVNTGSQGIDGKLKFETRLKVINTGGKLETASRALRLSGADSAVVLIAAATNFKAYNDMSGDPTAITKAQIGAAAAKSFDALRSAHITEHQRLFNRVSFTLEKTPAADLPTDQRIAKSMTQDDPQLAELYFNYGRYLLICSSRPGTQPANLQGIWNDSLNAPWGGKYTININTEMNYWPSEGGNLAECVEPLIKLVKEISVTGQEMAKVHYNAGGWVCHHNTDIWRATGPIDGAKFGFWPSGGAWLCGHLWDHYDYGRDSAYLKEIYPILKGASQFFLDVLVKEPKHGWLVTCPSMSPENNHKYGTSICAGPSMDMQIIRDLFGNTIKAAEILKTDKAFVKQVAAARAGLAPHQIGSNGQLQEWLDDWDMQAKDLHHRHVSHLYALFPSHQINVRDTPELAAAVRKSLEIRGDQATGWGTAWRINLWARLGQGDHARDVLNFLLGPDRTYPNMFDAHPPFQIDGNFGGASGMLEMVMQAWDDQIFLLPALPSAWKTGAMTGLRARGGFGVDVEWADGKLKTARVTSTVGRPGVLVYGGETVKLALKKGETVTFAFDGANLKRV